MCVVLVRAFLLVSNYTSCCVCLLILTFAEQVLVMRQRGGRTSHLGQSASTAGSFSEHEPSAQVSSVSISPKTRLPVSAPRGNGQLLVTLRRQTD